MNHFIIQRNSNLEHYFHKPYEGICVQQKSSYRWLEYQILYREGKEGFFVHCDANDMMHLICTNDNGDIVYLLNKGDAWHKYVLIEGNQKLFPERFYISPAGGRLNLFYTAIYNEESLLVYCVLGVNAKPVTVDKLSGNDFFVMGTDVYYTNESGVMGYNDFSDGKPDRFIPIADNAKQACAFEYRGREYITCKSGNKLLFGTKEGLRTVIDDRYAERPLLVASGAKLMLFWKSTEFIRYITTTDAGEKWSNPMRFLNSSRTADLFYVQSGQMSYLCYGSWTNNDVNLFGKQALFETPQKDVPTGMPEEPLEVQKLKIMIEMMRKDILDLKKQIILLKQQYDALQMQKIEPSSVKDMEEEKPEAGGLGTLEEDTSDGEAML